MSRRRRRSRGLEAIGGLSDRLRPDAPEPVVPPPDPASTFVVGRGSRGDVRADQRRGRRRRALLGSAAALVVVVVAAFAVVKIIADDDQGPTAAELRTQRTVLLGLVDAGRGVEATLLAHDPETAKAAVWLVPVRIIADIPGRGSATLAEAFAGTGLPRVAGETFADLVGVTVDATWTLAPATFAAFIDRLGGVEVTVDVEVLGRGPGGATVVVVPSGRQQLGGQAAYTFATYLAKGEDDQQRLTRLQAVLEGVFGVLQRTPRDLAATIGSLGPGSRTTAPSATLAAVLSGVADADAKDKVTYDTLPVRAIDTGGTLAYGLVEAEATAFVRAHLADSIPASRRTTGNRVLVQNGVGTPGLGESARRKLDAVGFVYRPGGNVPRFPYRTRPSVVIVADATAESVEKGERVARALGLPTSAVAISRQSQSVADVIVILGRDYRVR